MTFLVKKIFHFKPCHTLNLTFTFQSFSTFKVRPSSSSLAIFHFPPILTFHSSIFFHPYTSMPSPVTSLSTNSIPSMSAIQPNAAVELSKSPWNYPKVRRDEKLGDNLFNKFISDPYRWLEDPESEETKKFVDEQSTLTEKYINKCEYKKDLLKSLTQLYNFERYGCPFKEGNHYYYFHNTGLQAQSVLYQLKDLDATPTVFFDPNTLSKDGTIALSTFAFSEDGTYFAYAISKSGSDWVTIHVMDSKDKTLLEDKVEYAKFTGISWTKDKKGFFYTRYPSIDEKDLGTETQVNLNAQVFYHVLGTNQSKDQLVYSDPTHPEYRAYVMQTDDASYLIQTVTKSTAPINLLSIAPYTPSMDLSKIEWIPIVQDWELGQFEYLANDKAVFYFKTNHLATRYRIVKYDLNAPELGFQEVLQEHPQHTLHDVTVVSDTTMAVVYTQDVKHTLFLYHLETGELVQSIDLPTLGSIDSVSGKRKYTSFFYKFSSFFNPGQLFHYDVTTRSQKLFKSSQLPTGFNMDELNAKQVFYPSKDGTSIPMFILSKKSTSTLKTSSSAAIKTAPTLLYGYGGFSISLNPTFSPTWLAFLLHFDGHVAIANIRGGGEYGEAWHQAGILTKKQTGFDDFQCAAQYLIQERYTTSNQLAINGGSNGGLLVCACLNQTPELFGAAVAEVPVIDMFRFHKFTIGHAWIADYGDPSNQTEFEVLSTYSPLHTITKTKSYPATLLMTSDHDDRVVPLHSYKYIATLQHYHGTTNPHPLMLLVERKAGHGAGKPTQKRIESAVNKLVFMGMALNVKYHSLS